MKQFFVFLISILVFCVPVGAQDDKSPWYERYEEITYSEIRTLIDEGKVEEARVLSDGWWVTVKTKNGDYFDARVTPQTPIADHFYDAGVPVGIMHKSVDDDGDNPRWLKVFYKLLPLVIFLVFLFFIFVVMGRFNKKNAGKYDEHLKNAEKLNDALLERTEKLQNEFLDRLERILTQAKNSNG